MGYGRFLLLGTIFSLGTMLLSSVAVGNHGGGVEAPPGAPRRYAFEDRLEGVRTEKVPQDEYLEAAAAAADENACEALRRIFADRKQWFCVNGRRDSAYGNVMRRMAEPKSPFGEAALRRCRGLHETDAEKMLTDAKKIGFDLPALLDVAKKYPLTASGWEALVLVATIHLERGQFGLADILFREAYRRDELFVKKGNQESRLSTRLLFRMLLATTRAAAVESPWHGAGADEVVEDAKAWASLLKEKLGKETKVSFGSRTFSIDEELVRPVSLVEEKPAHRSLQFRMAYPDRYVARETRAGVPSKDIATTLDPVLALQETLLLWQPEATHRWMSSSFRLLSEDEWRYSQPLPGQKAADYYCGEEGIFNGNRNNRRQSLLLTSGAPEQIERLDLFAKDATVPGLLLERHPSRSFPPGTMKKLGALKSLEHLELSKVALTPEETTAIAGLPRLRSLSIRGSGSFDPKALRLPAMKQLRFLDVVTEGHSLGTWLPGDEAVPALTHLRLRGKPKGPHGLERLSGIAKLEKLWLEESSLAASAFDAISAAKGIRHLDLSGSEIVDKKDFARLGKLPKLTYLALEGVDHVDLPFGSLESVTHLHLGKTRMDLSQLAAMRKLQSLSLENATLKKEDIERLAKLPGLKELDLGYARLSPDAVTALQGLTGLKRLAVNRVEVDDKKGERFLTQDERTKLGLALPKTEVVDALVGWDAYVWGRSTYDRDLQRARLE